MGNSFSGKKRSIKVMRIDGTTFKLKPPAQAAKVLAAHPGYNLLDSEEVKQIGLRARPLDPDAPPLKPRKLYFLVELPRAAADPRALSGRVWSGALRVGAKECLESLKLSRRTMSDLSSIARRQGAEAEETKDGAIRLKIRLPKAQVERLLRESKNAIEAAEKIAELCVMRDCAVPENLPLPAISAVQGARKEKRARFAEKPDEIIA